MNIASLRTNDLPQRRNACWRGAPCSDTRTSACGRNPVVARCGHRCDESARPDKNDRCALIEQSLAEIYVFEPNRIKPPSMPCTESQALRVTASTLRQAVRWAAEWNSRLRGNGNADSPDFPATADLSVALRTVRWSVSEPYGRRTPLQVGRHSRSARPRRRSRPKLQALNHRIDSSGLGHRIRIKYQQHIAVGSAHSLVHSSCEADIARYREQL